MNPDFKSTVLIVDDNEQNRYVLSELLLSHFKNINILEAGSGAEALKKVLESAIDIIILDVQMPDMNGFEVAKTLKMKKDTQDIPIVFLTAVYNAEEYTHLGFELGAVDYLSKPIDDNQLINKIALYLKLFETINDLRLTKNSLKQKSDDMAHIIDNSVTGMAITDANGFFIYTNDSYSAMLNYGSEELIGKSCIELSPESYLEASKQAFIEAYTKGFVKDFKKKCFTKDGRVIDVAMSITKMSNDKFILIASDITADERYKEDMAAFNEKLQAVNSQILSLNEELLLSVKNMNFERQKLQNIIDQIPSLVTLKDASHKWVIVNQAMCHFLNKSKEELLNKNENDFMPEIIAKKICENDKMAFRNSTTVITEEHLIDGYGQNKIFLSVKRPITLDDGSTGLIISKTDITERHETKITSALLDKFFETTNEGIIITDKEGVMTAVNPALVKMTGYGAFELIGSKPSVLKSGEHEAWFYEQMWKDILEKERWEGEIFNRKKSGEIFPEWLTITTIKDEGGNIQNFVGVALELTSLYEKQKEIDEQQKMMVMQSRLAAMGEMISMIAHQWRQPLNGLGTILQGVLVANMFGKLTNEKLEESISKANKQIQFMSQTIDNFRDFFKPKKTKENFSILQSIMETIAIVEDKYKCDGIDIIVNNNTTNCDFFGFKNDFMQVILSIVSNARDAISQNKIKNGKIEIEIYENGQDIAIVISDNGGGVDGKSLYKIFEPYFTTKDDSKGTGLGLYMSKMIIEKNMNGKIEAKNIEGGAQFHITLKRGYDEQ